MVGKGSYCCAICFGGIKQNIKRIPQVKGQWQFHMIHCNNIVSGSFTKNLTDTIIADTVGKKVRRIGYLTKGYALRKCAANSWHMSIFLLVSVHHLSDKLNMLFQFFHALCVNQFFDKRREGNASILYAFENKHIFAEKFSKISFIGHCRVE